MGLESLSFPPRRIFLFRVKCELSVRSSRVLITWASFALALSSPTCGGGDVTCASTHSKARLVQWVEMSHPLEDIDMDKQRESSDPQGFGKSFFSLPRLVIVLFLVYHSWWRRSRDTINHFHQSFISFARYYTPTFNAYQTFGTLVEVSLKASHGFEYKWILEANQIELETHLSHAELSQLESPELNIKQWSLWPYNSSPRQAFRVTRKSPNAWLADWVTAKATVWTREDERWNFKCH